MTINSSFTFGTNDNTSKTNSISSSNINFGTFNLAQNKSSSSGFSFGVDTTKKATDTVSSTDAKKDTNIISSNKEKVTSAYPPLSSKAPKPFGNTLKQPEVTTPTRPTTKKNAGTTGIASSYPPLSSTAPTPFSAKKATPSKPNEKHSIAEQKSQIASKQPNMPKGEQCEDSSSTENQRRVVKVNRKISTSTVTQKPTKDQKTKNPFSSINFASATAPSMGNKSTFSFGTNTSQPAAMNSQTNNLFKKNTETVSSSFIFGLSKAGTLIGSTLGDAFKFGSSKTSTFGSTVFGTSGNTSASTTEVKTTVFESTKNTSDAPSSPIKPVFGSLDGNPSPSFSSLAKSPEAKGQGGFGTSTTMFGSLDGKPTPSFSSLAKSPEAKGQGGFGTTTSVFGSGQEFNFGRSMKMKHSVVDRMSSSFASLSNKTSSDISTNTTQASTSKNEYDEECEKIAIKAISLSAPGNREVVDTKRAEEIVEYWKEKISQHRAVVLGMLRNKDQIVNIVLCDKLDLSNKSYTESAARIISDYLTKETKSQRSLASQVSIVNLADMIASRMEDEGLQVLKIISDSFKDSSLVDVDLSDNAMGSKGISACSSVLGGQYRSIKRLSLCNNGLSATSMEEIANILTSEEVVDDNENKSKRISISAGLEKLHFFNNMSGDDGCKSFSRILSKCGSKLNDLRFSSTRAGKQGSLLISSALEKLGEKTLQNLEKLDLADNSFGLDGAKSLCRALKHCKSLKYLNLSDCLLEAAGIELICKSLCDAEVMLEHLFVSSNELAESGSTHLTKLLRRCTTLKTFHAEENEMGSVGIRNLVNELPSTIEDLSLGWNECGKIGAQALVLASKRMMHLKQIHLDGNMFPEDEVNSLEEAFGKRLLEMEENDEDEDIDELLEKTSDDRAKKDVKVDDIKELPSCSSAKKASQVFDTADKEKCGILPSSMFDDLLEELGECFDSEEQRKRLAEVDPDETGTIDRFVFVMWYVRLVGTSDIDEENTNTHEDNEFDHTSVDSDEEQERAEEAAKIIAAFIKVGGKDDCKSIPSTDFGKLMEAMGTAYCAAAHQKTIKKLSEGGYVSIDSFHKWYMNWLFCDDDDDDDDEW